MEFLTPSSACNGVLFDATDRIEKPRFDGYAFVGGDIIVGDTGHADYLADGGAPIAPGADGCYVTILTADGGLKVGTDSGSNYPLFLYRHGDFWAISSSFYVLAQHVHALGKPVTVNHAMLDSWRISGTEFRQPTSFDTAIAEIAVVPSFKTLRIADGAVRFENKAQPVVHFDSYEAALSAAISTSLARIGAAQKSGRLSLRIDLSGGLDSRTVFAMAAFLEKNGAPEIFRAGNAIRSSTRKEAALDFEIARRICDARGLALNAKPDLVDEVPMSAEAALESWRIRRLGIHGAGSGIPVTSASEMTLKLGGGGGENHRMFYDWRELDQRFPKARRQFLTQRLARDWYASTAAAIDDLTAHTPGSVDSILHYCEFRSRFHFGVTAYHRMSYLSLSSREFRAAAAMRPDHLPGNVLYDVLASLDEGLLKFPFDDARKNLALAATQKLVRVEIGDIDGGAVYGVRLRNRSSRKKSHRRARTSIFEMMEAAYADARPQLRGLGVPRGWIERGREKLAEGRQLGYFPKGADLKYYHYSELCALLGRLTALRRPRRSLLDGLLALRRL